MTKELVIVRPDDWHLHLRDEDFLPITVNESAKSFARAIIMPNLVPPITKLIDAKNYKRRIMIALKPNLSFDPLMTLYLTEETEPKEVKEYTNKYREGQDHFQEFANDKIITLEEKLQDYQSQENHDEQNIAELAIKNSSFIRADLDKIG